MKKLKLTSAASVMPNHHGVLLSSDLGDFQLHGRDTSEFIELVLPLLEGEFDQAEICTRLPQYSDQSILNVLQLLRQYGLLEDALQTREFHPPGAMQERFLRYWHSQMEPSCQRSDFSLAACKLLIVGLEPWSMSLIDALCRAGVGHIHLLDKEVVSEDDLVCHAGIGVEHLGEPRREVWKTLIEERCEYTTLGVSALSRSDHLGLPSTDWDLVVVALGKDSSFWLHQISEFIQLHTLRAVYGHLDGLESWIGPAINLNQGHADSCWNCLRLRKLGAEQNGELAHELEKSHSKAQDSRSRSMLTPMAAMTGQQLAMEVLKILWGYTQCDLASQVLVHNLITSEAKKHAIVPIPWCQVCGFEHSKAKAHTLTTVPDEEGYRQNGSGVTAPTNPLNHLRDIAQFKALFKGWVDPLTGVVRQLSGHGAHLPDYPVTASAGVSAFTEGCFDHRAAGQVGSGKGLDDISAHISAVGEALERYSAARYRLSDCKYAAIRQLDGDYIDPESLVLYSNRQYSSPNFPFHKWHRKQKIHWCQGTWLASNKKVWVPALVSYFNFACPHKEQFSQVSSNGLAAGQNNEDAALRACYELIERDAMMLTWYAQLPCQRLSYDSLNRGKMGLMIDALKQKGLELECYLLDVGLHVPTVVCLAMGDGVQTPAVSVALATHGDIQVAMLKALLEQGHVMPYLCHLMGSGQPIPRDVSQVNSLEDHAAYYFSLDKKTAFDFMRRPQQEAMHVEDWPYPVLKNVDDLKACLDKAGIDIAVVDVTSPDIALSPFRVARAIGVNMQPIHFGEQFKRVDNPRLRKLLQGRPVNLEPHPIA